jgi:glutathione S-transferase
MGASYEDEYEILNLLGIREDLSKLIYQIFFPTEDQKARRDEIIVCLNETGLPFFLEAWEKKYVAHHGKYFLGDKFSLADIFVTCFAETIFNMKGSKEIGLDQLLPKHAPKLAAHIENIKNNELGNYFKTVFNYEASF